MEKVYIPYLLMNKKRYAGLMYTKNKDGNVVFDYMDAKGIQLIRRDNCPLAKKAQQNVLVELLHNMNPEGAIAQTREILERIVRDEYPISEYKMSKSLRKDYKSEDLPHVFVKKKMEERHRGSGPQIGDRVPYVLVETKDLKSKAWEKAEDPKYAEENAIPVDRLYYVEHQIVTPVTGLLDFVEEIPDPHAIFEPYLNELRRQREHNVDIRTMLQPVSSATPAALLECAQPRRLPVDPPPKKKAKKPKDAPSSSMDLRKMLMQ
jgi:DNA polymerase delta subunit 1